MTHDRKRAPRRPVLPAAALIGALALGGCSPAHIGESWQCPLAEGGSCDSVAAADPAVPGAGAAGKILLAEPLWRQRAGQPGSPAPSPCEADCSGGFDPLGWFARLFGGGGEDESTAAAPASPAASPPAGPKSPAAEADPARRVERETVAPASAALPAEPGSAGPGAEGLRTGEVVARIWIAPFVDAAGIYREASYVRIVLEPAGWRLK